MIELIASLIALAGALGLGLAALALHRMPDVYSRLSATSKAVTLGAALLLAAAAVYAREPGVTARAIAGMAFLLLTSPIAGHVLGRAAWRAGEPASVTYQDPFATGHGTDPEEEEARVIGAESPLADLEEEDQL